jgi:hypothetical protein
VKLIQIKELTVGLNNPRFSFLFSGKEKLLNNKGHPESFELTLVEGMIGEVVEQLEEVFFVKFPFYPISVYVWAEHTKEAHKFHDFFPIDKTTILKRLLNCLGRAYLWGGNHVGQTTAFFKIFKYQGNEKREKRALCLDGIDCSGLLFFATNFQTPRNTKELQTFGSPISTLTSLKPLDLILTKGHVRIVLDSNQVIQSKQNRGVFLSRLDKELYFLKKNYKQVDEVKELREFSIRRFIF